MHPKIVDGMVNSVNSDQIWHSAASDQWSIMLAQACLSQYLGVIMVISTTMHFSIKVFTCISGVSIATDKVLFQPKSTDIFLITQ